MLRVLGSQHTLCDGIARREALRIGGLGALGLSLADVLRLQAAASPSGTPAPETGRHFGRAKSCILLFPYGSPPQHETFDPKPHAPTEIQGELRGIPSANPDLDVCELLPRTAQIADRLTVVRSMTHPYPLHCLAYVTSGIPEYEVSLETRPRDPRHWPFIGSIVDFLDARRAPAGSRPMPTNIGLPWLTNSQSDIPPLAGPYAAFLGQNYDPFWPTWQGKGTRIAPKLSDGQTKSVYDPFAGIDASGRFVVAQSADDAALTLDRFDRRRSLLQQFESARRTLDAHDHRSGTATHAWSAQQQLAFSLLTSSRLGHALSLDREPQPLRDAYGMTLFGQSCLAARRLVEAGARFVTVFWDAVEIFAGCAWDTHANHYPRLREYLLPGMDLALSALITDLETRGLLDETLVLWMSEHGRTPQIDPKPRGAGRHHWSRAYSIALAGAGIARGRVVGSTDATGGDVHDNPVSPKDILATTLHLLGISPETLIHDQQHRPFPVAGNGQVRFELLD